MPTEIKTLAMDGLWEVWNIHTGYWSFESGALVKILGLDDCCLKDQPYYPYDWVHWND